MFDIIDVEGVLAEQDVAAKPGQTLFRVVNNNSGSAGITIQTSANLQVSLSSETGCRGGKGIATSYVRHTLYIQELNPAGAGPLVELDTVGKAPVNDWNGTAQAIRVLEANKTYRIYGRQENRGPAVINTTLVGVSQA